MAYHTDLDVSQWVDKPVIPIPIRLTKSFIHEDYTSFPGRPGYLVWRIDDFSQQLLEGLDKRLELKFSFDAHDRKCLEKSMLMESLIGYLHLHLKMPQELRELELDRIGLAFQFRLHGRVGKTGHTFADGTYRVALHRREGTHLLGIDLGTSSCCIALQERNELVPPRMLDLHDNSSRPAQLFPSGIWLIEDPSGIHKKEDLVGPVDLAGEQRWLGLGHDLLEEGMTKTPPRIIPSLKKMIEAPAGLWTQFGLPEPEDPSSIPISLLENFLKFLFNKMYHHNKRQWLDVLIDEVVLTVPNNTGYHFVDRLRKAAHAAINGCTGTLKKGLLSSNWHIPLDKIHILCEADAAAAEYLNRASGETTKGRGEKPVGTNEMVTIFDLGAGTCDASIVHFEIKQDDKTNCVIPRLSIYERIGLNRAGDELDTIFANFILDTLGETAKSVKLEPSERNLLFGNRVIPDEEICGVLKKWGICGSYTELSRDIPPSAIDTVQLLRLNLKKYAVLLKEAIADLFYHRMQDPTFEIEVEGLTHSNERQELLSEFYRCLEIKDHDRKERECAVKAFFENQRDHFLNMRVLVRPARSLFPLNISGPIVLSCEAFWKYPAFVTFRNQLVERLLAPLVIRMGSHSGKAVLCVLLTGRLLAFPMIAESFLEALLRYGGFNSFFFPNSWFGPLELKNAVVKGALRTRLIGQSPSFFSLQIHTNYYLLTYDQKANKLVAHKLVANGKRFHKDRSGNPELVGRVAGVRLRQFANSIEILRIIRSDLDLPDLAEEWKKDPSIALPVMQVTIDKVGPFHNDNDRVVIFRIRPNGWCEVKLYPQTDSKTKKGRGQARTIDITRASRQINKAASGPWSGFPM